MRIFGFALAAVVAALTFAAVDTADAARLGGGRSMGSQRQSISPQKQAPAAAQQPVMPSQATPAKPATPTPAPAPSGMSRWLGPIAGLAAGLGIAALLSHFGLGEGAASFLMLALLVVGVIFLVRMFLARRSQAQAPMQYAGAGANGEPPARRDAEPSAWGGAQRVEPVISAPPAQADAPAKRIPPGFDTVSFVRHAKDQFTRLQSAYDKGDLRAMGDVMTPELLAEVRRDLDARLDHRATEIVTLEAEVLEVVTEGERHWASVRYTGQLREDGEPLPKNIDEVWNLTKPVDGSTGWLLAGIQQYA